MECSRHPSIWNGMSHFVHMVWMDLYFYYSTLYGIKQWFIVNLVRFPGSKSRWHTIPINLKWSSRHPSIWNWMSHLIHIVLVVVYIHLKVDTMPFFCVCGGVCVFFHSVCNVCTYMANGVKITLNHKKN